ncbi:hypothetical protein [Thalassomonas sp. RHCl1]|uniref:hypothetical protein n=1 Tax=Thalassomonas sp. RHCl1 TaxID=2995320 RepID=UPI00248C9BC5|nr:hypothetical protein [Thalassomonas sp. RHCl1]
MSEYDWMRKNWLGLFGLIVGFVGLISSYYFYAQSVKEREPMFIEELLRTVVVEADSLRDFPLKIVNRDGKPVEKDLTSFRVYFWNNGKEPIKSSDILKPIEFFLDSSEAEIIDIKIISASRKDIINPVVQLKDKNRVSLHFDILEQADGFSLQVLYAGSPKVPLKLNGVIEGVKYIQTNGNLASNYYNVIYLQAILPAVFTVIFLFWFVRKLRLAAKDDLAPDIVIHKNPSILGVDESGKSIKLIKFVEKNLRPLLPKLFFGMVMLLVLLSMYAERQVKIEKEINNNIFDSVPTAIRTIAPVK